MSVVDLGGEPLEVLLRLLRADVRQQELEGTAEHLARRPAEDALAGGVDGLDAARVIDGDDGVLDVVQDGLQMRRILLADLPRQRLGLVGHQLHGTYDAAPLAVDPVVVRAHGAKQSLQIHSAAGRRGIGHLALEQLI
jgi:hypothetical protein